MQKMDKLLMAEIRALKQERNALILAHNYQLAQVQEVADHIGDSLALSRLAARAGEAVIVFCGVKFMAETAAILAPGKTVLFPVLEAGCPMAAMVDADRVRQLRESHPGCPVVCYVNSSAAVKAESDIACTSANAVAVVTSLPADKPVIFVPDQHLGGYVARQAGRALILPDGFCPAHARVRADEIASWQSIFPRARVVVHPECPAAVCDLADAVESTGGMLRYVKESDADMFIVGTEIGMVYRLRRDNPGKVFIPASEQCVCPDMKLIDLTQLRDALKLNRHVITVPEEIRKRAARAVERMIAIG